MPAPQELPSDQVWRKVVNELPNGVFLDVPSPRIQTLDDMPSVPSFPLLPQRTRTPFSQALREVREILDAQPEESFVKDSALSKEQLIREASDVFIKYYFGLDHIEDKDLDARRLIDEFPAWNEKETLKLTWFNLMNRAYEHKLGASNDHINCKPEDKEKKEEKIKAVEMWERRHDIIHKAYILDGQRWRGR